MMFSASWAQISCGKPARLGVELAVLLGKLLQIAEQPFLNHCQKRSLLWTWQCSSRLQGCDRGVWRPTTAGCFWTVRKSFWSSKMLLMFRKLSRFLGASGGHCLKPKVSRSEIQAAWADSIHWHPVECAAAVGARLTSFSRNAVWYKLLS